jgi:hypothetical protein
MAALASVSPTFHPLSSHVSMVKPFKFPSLDLDAPSENAILSESENHHTKFNEEAKGAGKGRFGFVTR